ncbi:MAG TPA: sigma-70 family RNA polymerase sigma factor [Polyangiaceae bacterium]|nr:sigma-70 family RNA polymerase sigma factor [Polyangiaceae bacterium]
MGPSTSVLAAAPERCFREGSGRFSQIEWDESDFRVAWQQYSHLGFNAERVEDDFVRLACLRGRPGAAEVLNEVYLLPLAEGIQRVCRSPELTDGVLQNLREKLLLPPAPRLLAYQAPGNFRAWLKVVATSLALDVARELGIKRQREVELDEQLEALAAGPEEQYVRAELQEAFREALRAAVKGLRERERQVLRMHLVAGWNITQIGRVFSVNKSTAARWLVAAKDQLHVLLCADLGRRLGANSGEDSLVLEEMPSRLDINLRSFFQTTGALAPLE